MKKNLILFSVLMLLILVTYFFQEQRELDRISQLNKKESLIDFEIHHIKLPALVANKINHQWKSQEVLLSHNSLKKIERKLSQIKIIKEINGDWRTFAENPLDIEINNVKYSFGDLSLDKQSFYLNKKDKIYLVKIDGESSTITSSAEEIEAIKFKELITELSKEVKDLKETQLFRFFPELNITKVAIEIEGHLPFELDFDHNQTNPPPFEGISIHSGLREKFFSLLTQASIKEEVIFKKNKNFKKISHATIYAKEREFQIELWIKNANSADAFIFLPDLNKAFSVWGGSMKFLFVPVQDYWDKKVIPQNNFLAFDKLEILFFQDKKSAKVAIFNSEPLTFKSDGLILSEEKMEMLVQYLLGLPPRDQADRVSLLSNSERELLLSGKYLRLKLLDQDIILWRKQQELIVANLTKGFKAHFYNVDENFLATFEDVLK